MFSTIQWSNGKVKIIDQTKLPVKLSYIYCRDVRSIWTAIKKMQIRGAPAIGITAAFGVVLGIWPSRARSYRQIKKELDKIIKYLAGSRPTAVNLFWALERMNRAAERYCKEDVRSLKKGLLKEALEILEEDKQTCRQMGRNGAGLLKNGDRILTHCNAGMLATADYGTALAAVYMAKKQGKKISVYVDESRPLFQGARLTSWELVKNGISATLICDNTAGWVMKKGLVDKILVGADRIAANGDSANKIGTYSLAVLARAQRIPFYVIAPVSTFDFALENGREIPIEERSPEEITRPFGYRIAPKGLKAYNPAFDVTPARYISAIVTERGIVRAPYKKSLREIKNRSSNSQGKLQIQNPNTTNTTK
ncbi:MAG: S-methyl-5-thioribose-1-phosphate isomerase [Candidatus Omnitrophota bacterium]|nr:S-methyl-5-thioribose-1-phosphate isomerase [Candidatus Omnitrophota bacterium]